MKAGLLFTGTGPLVVLTNCDSLDDERLQRQLACKGVRKFIAFELDPEDVRAKYGGHFDSVCRDLHQSDDLRVVDIDGHRILDLFDLRALPRPVIVDVELEHVLEA